MRPNQIEVFVNSSSDDERSFGNLSEEAAEMAEELTIEQHLQGKQYLAPGREKQLIANSFNP